MLINKVIREPIQESNPQISAKELNKLNLSKNMQSLHSITVQIVCALRDYFEWCAKAEERAKQIEKRFQSAQSKNISSMKLDDLSKLQMERPEYSVSFGADSGIFRKSSISFILNSVYSQCRRSPALEKLDVFRTDEQPSMKFYSYPQFFFDEWKRLVTKEHEERLKQRKARRKTKRQCKQINEIEIKTYNADGELVSKKLQNDDQTSKNQQVGVNQSYTADHSPSVTFMGTIPEDSNQANLMQLPLPEFKSLANFGTTDMLSISTPVAPTAPLPPAMNMAVQSSPKPVESQMALNIKSVTLKKTERISKPTDHRTVLLSSIKSRAAVLKSVQSPTDTPISPKYEDDESVATLLMRRAALETSDSEGSEESDDSDWE